MQYTSYYVIRPHDQLVSKIDSSDNEASVMLLTPVLWTIECRDRTSITQEVYDSAVKCMFISHLKSNLLSIDEINSTFGMLDTSSSTSDKWWKLEVFRGIDVSAEDIASTFAHDEPELANLNRITNPVINSLLWAQKSTDSR